MLGRARRGMVLHAGAWVLWMHSYTITRPVDQSHGDWERVAASPTLEACQQAQAALFDRLVERAAAKQRLVRDRRPPDTLTLLGDGRDPDPRYWAETVSLRCFPDGDDPRLATRDLRNLQSGARQESRAD